MAEDITPAVVWDDLLAMRIESAAAAAAAASGPHRSADSVTEVGMRATVIARFVDPDGKPLRCASFDPTGSFLAIGSNSQALRVARLPAIMFSDDLDDDRRFHGDELAPHSPATLELPLLQEWPRHHAGSVYDVAWADSASTDAYRLASQCLYDLSYQSRGLDSVPGPTLLASGGNDALVRVASWQYERGGDDHGGARLAARYDPAHGLLGAYPTHVAPYRGHKGFSGTSTFRTNAGTVRSVCFVTTAHLATAGGTDDHAVRVWDVAASVSAPLAAMRGHTGIIHGLSRCGISLVASASSDGTVRVWDARVAHHHGSAATLRFPSTCGAPQCVTFSAGRLPTGAPSGIAPASDGLLATGHEDGSVAVADLRVLSDGHSDRSLVAHRRVHEAEVRSVSFSPCGTALATASFDGTSRILTSGMHGDQPAPLSSLRLLDRLHTDRLLSASWHPWFPLLCTTSADGSLCITRLDLAAV